MFVCLVIVCCFFIALRFSRFVGKSETAIDSRKKMGNVLIELLPIQVVNDNFHQYSLGRMINKCKISYLVLWNDYVSKYNRRYINIGRNVLTQNEIWTSLNSRFVLM